MEIQFTPIGIVRSCFKEKFGIPRQPGVATFARARLELYPPYDDMNMVRELESFSHIWIIYYFHGCPEGKWQKTVRPPRLGGNRRVGVFASRSYYRPNPLGMSPVKLEGIKRENGQTVLILTGIDILDNTPVIDIKPYLPYADSIPSATGGYAPEPPEKNFIVLFEKKAEEAADRISQTHINDFKNLVVQILKGDPRPGYVNKKNNRTSFGMRLYDYNIKWDVTDKTIVISEIIKVS